MDIIEKAFLAGRSSQSWEDFKNENEIDKKVTEKWLKSNGFVYGNNHGLYCLLKVDELGDYDDRNIIYVWDGCSAKDLKTVQELKEDFKISTGKEFVSKKLKQL